jgi:transcriptional regulator with GAF, ATPase, and Fis domain
LYRSAHEPSLGAEVTTRPATQRVLTKRELREFEANNIRAALAASDGKIYGAQGAAARLELKPTTLASRIKSLRINE